MVALRGPSTPYELKRAVGRSIGYFWPFPHAQFYSEPSRLSAAGLLREERETGGRRRRIYAVTDPGRAALAAWLREPTSGPMEIRDLAELKLFFSELVDADDVALLAREPEQSHRARIAELEAIDARFGDDPGRARRMAPLRLGMTLYRAAVDFWHSIAEDPPGPDSGPADQPCPAEEWAEGPASPRAEIEPATGQGG
jgi:DNA-binding PadR family transcriptional regulator